MMKDKRSTKQRSAEQWRSVPIPGFEASYQVSDLGRVRSLDRITRNGHRLKGKILRQSLKNGRPCVTLSVDGALAWREVPVLVALAFLGPRPATAVICHYDDVKTNNRARNLRYDSQLANMADKARNGHGLEGARNHQAKLRGKDVRRIRELLASGATLADLGRTYGVCSQAIHNIKTRKTWKHIP